MIEPSAEPPRPTWPLYLLAGLSFVPFLGFFVGSVAVSWGLISSRPGARRAVVIAGTGALLNAVGAVLLVTVLGSGNAVYREEYVLGVRQNLGELVLALEDYQASAHAYPESLQALQRARGPLRPLQILDLGAGLFRVPQPFQYVLAPDGASYDLFSVGPDGKPGTDDDLRPLVPDSLRGRTGLRP